MQCRHAKAMHCARPPFCFLLSFSSRCIDEWISIIPTIYIYIYYILCIMHTVKRNAVLYKSRATKRTGRKERCSCSIVCTHSTRKLVASWYQLAIFGVQSRRIYPYTESIYVDRWVFDGWVLVGLARRGYLLCSVLTWWLEYKCECAVHAGRGEVVEQWSGGICVYKRERERERECSVDPEISGCNLFHAMI